MKPPFRRQMPPWPRLPRCSLYSALGHSGTFDAEPLIIRLLDNAMGWLVAESGKACTA